MERRTLVTIITESAVESRLLKDLERLGARGYTILEARGKGSHGDRSAAWDQDVNLQIEVICDAQVAATITDFCREHYSADYAMVIYLSEVQVLRPEKF
jgi:nitrogen regulatory protein PII